MGDGPWRPPAHTTRPPPSKLWSWHVDTQPDQRPEQGPRRDPDTRADRAQDTAGPQVAG